MKRKYESINCEQPLKKYRETIVYSQLAEELILEIFHFLDSSKLDNKVKTRFGFITNNSIQRNPICLFQHVRLDFCQNNSSSKCDMIKKGLISMSKWPRFLKLKFNGCDALLNVVDWNSIGLCKFHQVHIQLYNTNDATVLQFHVGLYAQLNKSLANLFETVGLLTSTIEPDYPSWTPIATIFRTMELIRCFELHSRACSLKIIKPLRLFNTLQQLSQELQSERLKEVSNCERRINFIFDWKTNLSWVDYHALVGFRFLFRHSKSCSNKIVFKDYLITSNVSMQLSKFICESKISSLTFSIGDRSCVDREDWQNITRHSANLKGYMELLQMCKSKMINPFSNPIPIHIKFLIKDSIVIESHHYEMIRLASECLKIFSVGSLFVEFPRRVTLTSEFLDACANNPSLTIFNYAGKEPIFWDRLMK